MAWIQLDSQGLIWVLLPVLLITLLSAIARLALNQLSVLKGGGNVHTAGMPSLIQNFAQIYTSNVTSVSRMARASAKLMTPEALNLRRKFYVGENNDGKLSYPPAQSDQPAMPQVDPSSMLGGMKYRFVSLMMDAGLAYLISYLFAECVVARVPFGLPAAFKPILQRGIAVQDLDPEFISPLSWYFVVLFSSGSFTFLFNYISGLIQTSGPSILETMNPMAAGAGSAPSFGQPDSAKQFSQEGDHWKLQSSELLLENIEKLASVAME